MEARSQADVVRTHVRRIAESAAFKTSERSREFLMAIVEKALDGRFEELKERVLGVELFGRDSSYDTGEDAIVRVTASDVRRRLQRYYREFDGDSTLRIDIPAGSYIPDFQWAAAAAPAGPVEETAPANEPVEPVAATEPAFSLPGRQRRSWNAYLKSLAYVGVGFALGTLAMVAVSHLLKTDASETLPWSSLLQDGQRVQIVVSDSDLSKMQSLGGYDLSLSDYANRRYQPAGLNLSPELSRVMRMFRGASMGTVEVTTALAISKRLFPHTQQVSIFPARGLQLKDFRTDDNFVLLGSPRSNPWVALFQDQLDFQFYYDAESANERVRNRKPGKDEVSVYKPSARGGGTGDAFGLISFLANPNQSGHVLLVAGSNAEATEAAGRYVLDREAMNAILGKHGVSPSGKPVPFQILLRVNTMAGSPGSFFEVAFHQLHS